MWQKKNKEYFKDRKYSDLIDVIGIIPIIAPREQIKSGEYREQKKCSVVYGIADVYLCIDYDQCVERSSIPKKCYIPHFFGIDDCIIFLVCVILIPDKCYFYIFSEELLWKLSGKDIFKD